MLPKWAISNEESVWRETERSRQMTPAERWRETQTVCGILRPYWSIPGQPERLRNAVDRLPESSERALARLRDEYRRSRR